MKAAFFMGISLCAATPFNKPSLAKAAEMLRLNKPVGPVN
jgi:hypothetical protein